METPNFQPESHVKMFDLIRQASTRMIKETLQQIALADLNPHEGRLRASIAPAEYLPQPPDFPPATPDAQS